MYEISICEDEPIFSVAMEQTCREILEDMGADYRISVFSNGVAFLEAFRQRSFHLYLLDVILGDMNGIELGQQIRDRDPKGTIIFTTSSPDYAIEGYRVHALRYLLKPVEKELLKPLLSADYRTNYLTSHITLVDGNRKVRVPTDQIIYMEKVGRRIKVCTLLGLRGEETQRDLYFSGAMSELLDQLPGDHFVRCHQGYAVNIARAVEIDRLQIVTPLGNVPISRTYGPAVQKAYLKNL